MSPPSMMSSSCSRHGEPMVGTAASDRRRWLGAAGAAALGLALPPAARAAVATGRAAPDFTLRTGEGRNLRLAEQRGQVVMVNFWATWCTPCRVEMPHLQRIHEQYRSAGFLLLGVSVDDDPAKALELARRMGLTFPILFDTDKAVSRRYDLKTMPSTMLIDRDGSLRQVHRGYKEGVEQLYAQQVRDLLKEA